jgi:NADH-quinone oxidoreductase subunit G
MSREPFVGAIREFHLTNPIARASKTMAECAELVRARSAQPVAAE